MPIDNLIGKRLSSLLCNIVVMHKTTETVLIVLVRYVDYGVLFQRLLSGVLFIFSIGTKVYE